MTRFIEVYDTEVEIKRLINTSYIISVESFNDNAVVTLSMGADTKTIYTDTPYVKMMFELTRIDRG